MTDSVRNPTNIGGVSSKAAQSIMGAAYPADVERPGTGPAPKPTPEPTPDGPVSKKKK